MKKSILVLAIALLLTLTSACEEKKKEVMIEKEETIPKGWEEMCNAPQGYPIEVYKGGLEKRNAQGEVLNSRGLSGYGLSTGFRGWGSSGGGMGRSQFVPTHLNCIWLSYAENTFYKIDCAIDHDKMLKLFQEGYPNRMWFENDGRRVKSYFNSIITGFAPGGVVVVWLAGGARQVEIGRYKGEKYEISPSEEELEEMGYPTRNLFDPKYHKFIVTNKDVVPLEVQLANKNKPIPYGLWDSLRLRYNWRPVFEVQEDGFCYFSYFEMVNGEKENLFDVSLKENKFRERAIPTLFNMYWKDKTGQKYGANEIIFDGQEVTAAYKELFKENKDIQAELVFTVNHTNNYITILLKSGDTKIRLSKTVVKVH